MKHNIDLSPEAVFAIDLRDFSDECLKDNGELEIRPDFDRDIYIAAGKTTLLSLSRIPDPSNPEPDMRIGYGQRQASGLYVLKNLFPESGAAKSVTFDDQRRTEVVVGRTATPELGLSRKVSGEHFAMRIGGMSGHLHFADLGSTNGTTVYISREESRVGPEPQSRSTCDDGSGQWVLRTVHEQRWLR